VIDLTKKYTATVHTTRGDFVIAPFVVSDNTCVNCRNGVQTSCLHGASWGGADEAGYPVDGGQGEWVRVPLADGTLVALEDDPDAELVPSLLSLSDVMGTGHHAAIGAGVGAGQRGEHGTVKQGVPRGRR